MEITDDGGGDENTMQTTQTLTLSFYSTLIQSEASKSSFLSK
jgi:hypothetical protein